MKKRGFTLVEATFVTVIMTMLMMGVVSILATSIASFNTTSNQYYVDVGVSTAMQYLNRDVQEAKEVKVLSETEIRVFYPVVDEKGAYDRNVVAENTAVDYYRGDLDGRENPKGACLVRKPSLEPPRVVCRDVSSVSFSSSGPASIEVSIATERNTMDSKRKGAMTKRTIYLRNN
ncbi:MAG: prepilin-type N-terminal cleavage/methylation domain-containing protein [Armatimonadetes bacterium]|nr:prepilin-type N-terminal cleavage/methylation domain-containing protein [Armatimonadota bacterium]